MTDLTRRKKELLNSYNNLCSCYGDIISEQTKTINQLKELLKTCKYEFEKITKLCNTEFEYVRKLANNFHIPAEDLAVILQSTNNKELLTKINNAIGEK